MKKFQFAAGFAALAMLASCSSDAPDFNGSTEEGDGHSFIAMRITTPATRADEAVASKDDDSEINDITLYIVDKQGNNYTTLRRLYTENIENGYAYFNVTSYVFDDLAKFVSHQDDGNTELGKKVMLKVYANTSRMSAFANEGMYVTGRTTDDGEDTWKAGDFCMSNNTETTAFLSPAGVGKDGTTKENAWVINGGGANNQAVVTLDRLATRFDLKFGDGKTDGVYTAEDIDNMTITMQGVAINTHETNAYWFLQNGDATPNRAHTCNPKLQFNNGNSDLTPSDYTHVYDLVLPTSSTAKSTTYAHPHTLASSFYTDGKYDIGFKNASYAAIRCTFSHPTMGNATKVFTHNGYYLGSFAQFKAGELQDLYDNYPETEQAWIAETMASTTLTEETLAQAATMFTRSSSTAPFYCYYSVILRNDGNDSKDTRTLENVKIMRNTCYSISVDKIKKIGFTGTDVPHDEVEDSMLWIDLNIQVAPWISNTANEDIIL